MKINILLASSLLLCSLFTSAQVAINTDGSAPNSSAMLDVKSSSKGILIPRMTSAERGLISGPVAGLMVYQTNAPAGYYYYTGTSWKQMIDALATAANPPANNLLTFDGTNWVAKNIVVGLTGGSQPVTHLQPYLCMNYCIALYGIWPAQSGTDAFTGEIELFGFGYTPNGWAACNGQLMSISENTALFALLGTTYGGDGVNTFGLPDLRGRVPINQGTGPGLTNRVMGQTGGSDYFYLSVPQIPAHAHTVTFQ
ncbi:MAG: tail fiber protein [Bacteroidetes bacterium]|nr:tail fiber protein [Bacteroidota bacterium]